MKFNTLLGLSVAASTASACSFSHLITDNHRSNSFEYVRPSNGTNLGRDAYLQTDFRCNSGVHSSLNRTKVLQVKAGKEIGFATENNLLNYAAGPLSVYLSKAPTDVRFYDGSGEWFKIHELGPKSFTQQGIEWSSFGLAEVSFTLPEDLPSGQYLLRIEQIGFGDHEGDREFFVNCAQIKVHGHARRWKKQDTVTIPGIYKGSEAALNYVNGTVVTSYEMPGPKPMGSIVSSSAIPSVDASVIASLTASSTPAVSSSQVLAASSSVAYSSSAASVGASSTPLSSSASPASTKAAVSSSISVSPQSSVAYSSSARVQSSSRPTSSSGVVSSSPLSLATPASSSYPLSNATLSASARPQVSSTVIGGTTITTYVTVTNDVVKPTTTVIGGNTIPHDVTITVTEGGAAPTVTTTPSVSVIGGQTITQYVTAPETQVKPSTIVNGGVTKYITVTGSPSSPTVSGVVGVSSSVLPVASTQVASASLSNPAISSALGASSSIHPVTSSVKVTSASPSGSSISGVVASSSAISTVTFTQTEKETITITAGGGAGATVTVTAQPSACV